MIVCTLCIVIMQMVLIILGFQSARLELFSDYEVMDTDPIISSALDIYQMNQLLEVSFGEILKNQVLTQMLKVSLKIYFMIY